MASESIARGEHVSRGDDRVSDEDFANQYPCVTRRDVNSLTNCRADGTGLPLASKLGQFDVDEPDP